MLDGAPRWVGERNPIGPFELFDHEVVNFGADEFVDLVAQRHIDRVIADKGLWRFRAPPMKVVAAVAPVAPFPLAQARCHVTIFVRGVLKSNRNLPTDVRLPIEWSLAGLESGDVE